MFAKPLLGSLGRGHVDGVYKITTDPSSLERLASGSGDGVVKVWDLASRDEIWQAKAHDNIVRGLCWSRDKKLLSCAADRTIKIWDPYSSESASNEPVASWLGKDTFTSISHHRNTPHFAVSSSSGIAIYDSTRPGSSATTRLAWPNSVDTISCVAFNQLETSLLASTASDRSIVLYDLRTASPLHRTVLTLSCNAVSWNPQEAFTLAAASEDHNIYVFDSRALGRAANVLQGHVAAATDVAWAPTGAALVSAGYDRSLRVWDARRGRARDIYHARRMQRVFSVVWSADNDFVLSGSDDGNVRLWRAEAAARQGVMTFKQRQALQEADALKKRYAHMPEIKRIARHRHLPKVVKKAGEIKNEELAAIKRREENERKHSRKGEKRRRPEREKMVLAVEE